MHRAAFCIDPCCHRSEARGRPARPGHPREDLDLRIAIHFLHPHAQLYCTCACACACACACICAACGTRDMKKKTKSYISCLKKRPVKQARTTVVVKSQRSLFPCTHDTLPYASLVPPHLAPCGCATRAVAYPPQHTPHSSLPVRPPSARLLYAFLHFTRLPSFRARLLSTPSRAHSSCRRCP